MIKIILLVLLSSFTWPAFAQWEVSNEAANVNTDASQSGGLTEEEAEKLAQFEKSKCVNGGSETRAFIDFSTQDPVEAAYIEQIGQRFSQTVQEQQLGIEFSEGSARSVRFLFELNSSGGLKSLTVFASEEDVGLREFVTRLVTDSVPYPSYKETVDSCYQTLVVSAILDF